MNEPDHFGLDTKRAPHYMLWFIMIFIAIMITWAYYATLDEVTHAEGKVVPSKKVQVVQNLEGGIVKDINVKEGDTVKTGQVLMQLDNTRFENEYKEGKTESITLAIKLKRLQAEVQGSPFVPPTSFIKENPEYVLSQQEQFESRQKELEALRARQNTLQQEVNMLEPLIQTGAASKLELLRAQQKLSTLEGEISNFKTTALNELNDTRAQLQKVTQNNLTLLDRLKRTTVRSPVNGIVKSIEVNTVGGVIKPGMDLMEIVPLDETLLVEARVKPSDIGFLHPGQGATVKISAYDFSIYGGLDGTVEHIGADSQVDEDGDSYYEIWVRTKQNSLKDKRGKELRIIPGMTATVDILTGKKSVLDYILKPILKTRATALRER